MSVSRYMATVALVAIAGLCGCGDATEPRLIPIPDEAREAMLVDVSTGALAEPSAFDVITGESVRTDLSFGWDFVFQISRDSGTVLWPRGAITGEGLDAGLRLSSLTFDGLREAPESGYTNLESVPVAAGDVFAVRSRRDPAYGSARCRRYAKVEVLEVDLEGGTISFRHLVNPNCEKRKLVMGAEE